MRLLAVFVLCAALIACSEDPSDPYAPPRCRARGEPDGGPDPSELCEVLLTAMCDREVECRDDAPNHVDCVSIQRDRVDCGAVKGVAESFDRCIADIGGQSCIAWNADTYLPASCSLVLTDCEAETVMDAGR